MDQTTAKLSGLIVSRICHDLISPVGAINNGLELLDLAHSAQGAEFTLIRDSAAQATSRIRFFRLAFGAAHKDQAVSAPEMASLLRHCFPGPLRVTWEVEETLIRPRAKAACLAILCLDRCLPYGGEIRVAPHGAALAITTQSEGLRAHDPYWSLLDGRPIPEDLPPAEVQFALLPHTAQRNGLNLSAQHTDDYAQISI